MKPETIERRRVQRVAAQRERRAEVLCRLRAKAQQAGPDSIWAELAREAQAGRGGGGV